MSLIQQFETELTAAMGHAPRVVGAQEGDHQLILEAIELNPLACRFDSFRLKTSALAGATIERLKRTSEELSARLTYLLEPIGPIEVDTQQSIVQMRSKPPQKDDDGRSYYELLVKKGGELVLIRYRKPQGQPRERIHATVTQEVLLRLAADFLAVV